MLLDLMMSQGGKDNAYAFKKPISRLGGVRYSLEMGGKDNSHVHEYTEEERPDACA